MSQPIIVDLPHKLGAAEAKRRIAGGIGRLKDHIPGGSAHVESGWEGDRMNLRVQAMGQEVAGHLDVRETVVHVELTLPAFLALFARQVEGLLRSRGAEMLEDRSGRKGG